MTEKERKQWMRNMVLLIDTNILLNYITNRPDPYLEQSVEIVRKCANGECTGYIAFHTLSTLWYVLRKRNDKVRRENLKDICEIFTVATASQMEILDAIEKDSFEDFEDCLQDKCAKDVGADYIITCNTKDFVNSEIPAITPDEYIKTFCRSVIVKVVVGCGLINIKISQLAPNMYCNIQGSHIFTRVYSYQFQL